MRIGVWVFKFVRGGLIGVTKDLIKSNWVKSAALWARARVYVSLWWFDDDWLTDRYRFSWLREREIFRIYSRYTSIPDLLTLNANERPDTSSPPILQPVCIVCVPPSHWRKASPSTVDEDKFIQLIVTNWAPLLPRLYYFPSSSTSIKFFIPKPLKHLTLWDYVVVDSVNRKFYIQGVPF